MVRDTNTTFGKRQLVFMDSETCGLHSMMVLLQWAIGKDGEIQLYEIWKNPVWKTVKVLEDMAENIVVGFNLSFDWFHVQKIHAIWSKLVEMGYGDAIPEDIIDVIVGIEKDCTECDCIKPYSAIDLMLLSRSGPYQSLMARKNVRIKRIPLTPVEWEGMKIPMAYAVASFLERTIEMDGIYFARTSDPDAPRWTVMDREKDGLIDRQFADVVLRFHSDGSLKSLAEHALGIPPKYKHSDIELDPKLRPIELGFAPYAVAISSADKNWEVIDEETGKIKGYAWPGRIQHHIEHWNTNEPAREYANDDIVYTRGLYYHFDEPEPGDTNSILACMVASVRWWGFELDAEGIKELREEAVKVVAKSPINTNKPCEIREYVNEMCCDTQKSFLEETTRKAKLEEMSKWMIQEDEECLECLGGLEPDCKICQDGVLKKGPHPASARAKEVLDIKVAKKEIELYDKLLIAGKFHASFRVIGTLSSRMAGGDGLNAQGIKKAPVVRRCFPLKRGKYKLCGGDFDGFEVTLADAVYDDMDLRKAIVSGQKLHALFGTLMFPGYSYDEIIRSEKFPEEYEFGDMYTKAKSGVFAMIYGGNASTLNRNQGITMEVAEQAYAGWGKMFPGIGQSRQRVIDLFQPLIQKKGLGTAIEWVEPQEYVESFLGFRRYFTLEYKIVKALFELARNLPKAWRQCDDPVVRSERRGVQKAWGALTSALYGAAFGIAEANVRAAANHEIQSPGADITKDVQVNIWALQPHGVHKFVVAPMNIHDEVMSVTDPEYVDRQSQVVSKTVEKYRDDVPLIGMKWCTDMDNWAEKKGGDDAPIVHITYDHEKVLKEIESANKKLEEIVPSSSSIFTLLDNQLTGEGIFENDS